MREAANALRTYIPQDDELADMSGLIREIEVLLATKRREIENAAKALQPPEEPVERVRLKEPFMNKNRPIAQGRMYELVPQYKNERSYNTPGLLTLFTEALDMPLSQVVASLSRDTANRERVLDLKWRWTPLQNYARQLGVKLNIRDGEVEDDLDGPHVGVVKKQTGVDRVPIVRKEEK